MSDAEKKVREVHPRAYLSGNGSGKVRVMVTQGAARGPSAVPLSGFCATASQAWEKALRRLQGDA